MLSALWQRSILRVLHGADRAETVNYKVLFKKFILLLRLHNVYGHDLCLIKCSLLRPISKLFATMQYRIRQSCTLRAQLSAADRSLFVLLLIPLSRYSAIYALAVLRSKYAVFGCPAFRVYAPTVFNSLHQDTRQFNNSVIIFRRFLAILKTVISSMPSMNISDVL